MFRPGEEDKLIKPPNQEEKNYLQRVAPKDMVRLQADSVTLNSNDITQLRQQILVDNYRTSRDEDIGTAQVLKQVNNIRNINVLSKINQNTDALKMINAISPLVAGRGVTKATLSPAQQIGYFPQNPAFFGMQMPMAVPYDRAVKDRQNLKAVLDGYSSKGIQGGMGAIVQSMKQREGLISAFAQRQYQPSVFDGVPTSTALNLANINLKNAREKNLYVFY